MRFEGTEANAVPRLLYVSLVSGFFSGHERPEFIQLMRARVMPCGPGGSTPVQFEAVQAEAARIELTLTDLACEVQKISCPTPDANGINWVRLKTAFDGRDTKSTIDIVRTILAGKNRTFADPVYTFSFAGHEAANPDFFITDFDNRHTNLEVEQCLSPEGSGSRAEAHPQATWQGYADRLFDTGLFTRHFGVQLLCKSDDTHFVRLVLSTDAQANAEETLHTVAQFFPRSPAERRQYQSPYRR